MRFEAGFRTETNLMATSILEMAALWAGLITSRYLVMEVGLVKEKVA